MLVDSHCHLDMLRLEQETMDDVLREAQQAGIEHLLCVSVSLERFDDMLELVAPYPQVSVSVGVHPDGTNVEEPGVERLVELARHPKVVAIGETGLDYYRAEDDTEWQRKRFRRHVRAARAAGKPLIVHTRDARRDTIDILRQEGADEVGGVMHCFTEDWGMARDAMDMNFRISFSGIVTFKNAAQVREVAQRVPSDYLLVETDAPYLAPVPMRGKSNRPAYVRYVAQFLAELRNEPLENLAATTTRNFDALFGRGGS